MGELRISHHHFLQTGLLWSGQKPVGGEKKPLLMQAVLCLTDRGRTGPCSCSCSHAEEGRVHGREGTAGKKICFFLVFFLKKKDQMSQIAF